MREEKTCGCWRSTENGMLVKQHYCLDHAPRYMPGRTCVSVGGEATPLDVLKAELAEHGMVALSRKTAAYLLELVERLEDEGPEGSGWKSQKLIDAIGELKEKTE